MSGEIEPILAVVVPKLGDVGRDCLQGSGGFIPDEEVGPTCQVAEDLGDPRYLVLPRDSGQGESPPVKELAESIAADIHLVLAKQFSLDPFHPVFGVFGENRFDLSFERGVFVSQSLLGIYGDVIGTLGDPQESADPVNPKELLSNLVSRKLDYFPLGESGKSRKFFMRESSTSLWPTSCSSLETLFCRLAFSVSGWVEKILAP